MASDQGLCEFRRTVPKPIVELGGIEPLRWCERRTWSRDIVPGQDAFSSILQ